MIWKKEIKEGDVLLVGTAPVQAVRDGEGEPCDICENCDLYFTAFCERCDKKGGYHFKRLPLEKANTWRLINPVPEEYVEKGRLLPKEWDKDGKVTRVTDRWDEMTLEKGQVLRIGNFNLQVTVNPDDLFCGNCALKRKENLCSLVNCAGNNEPWGYYLRLLPMGKDGTVYLHEHVREKLIDKKHFTPIGWDKDGNVTRVVEVDR